VVWYFKMEYIVGMDTSHKLTFVGIVIGRWVDIKSCWSAIARRLRVDSIHMYKFSLRLKKMALRLLCEFCSGLKLLCVKVNYPRLRSVLRNLYPRIPRQKLTTKINRIVKAALYDIIREYCNRPRIIVDKELLGILNAACEPREPIEIADILAWFNLRKNVLPRELRTCLRDIIMEIDIENKLIQIARE